MNYKDIVDIRALRSTVQKAGDTFVRELLKSSAVLRAVLMLSAWPRSLQLRMMNEFSRQSAATCVEALDIWRKTHDVDLTMDLIENMYSDIESFHKIIKTVLSDIGAVHKAIDKDIEELEEEEKLRQAPSI